MYTSSSTANFELLYKGLQPRLYAYCRKFIDDPETAKDLVQDAFVKLWEDEHFSTIHTSVAAYMHKTVHNQCLLYLRDRQIRQCFESYAAFKLKEAELNFLSPENGTYSSIFLRDIEDIVEKCIEKLPPQSQRIFKMSRMDNLPYNEIAAQLGISVRTVENLMYRTLCILKTALHDYLLLTITALLSTLI
jgi:RNA polymerase sigma-70 factor (ECF subfamily)